MEQKILFEDKYFKIETSGRDYDFIYLVFNKTDYDIQIVFDEDSEWGNWRIETNGYIGLFNNELTDEILEKLKSNNYKVKGEE